MTWFGIDLFLQRILINLQLIVSKWPVFVLTNSISQKIFPEISELMIFPPNYRFKMSLLSITIKFEVDRYIDLTEVKEIKSCFWKCHLINYQFWQLCIIIFKIFTTDSDRTDGFYCYSIWFRISVSFYCICHSLKKNNISF